MVANCVLEVGLVGPPTVAYWAFPAVIAATKAALDDR